MNKIVIFNFGWNYSKWKFQLKGACKSRKEIYVDIH
jgi:hypothetical protein